MYVVHVNGLAIPLKKEVHYCPIYILIANAVLSLLAVTSKHCMYPLAVHQQHCYIQPCNSVDTHLLYSVNSIVPINC